MARVLVVEDDASIRKMVALGLQQGGHTVLEAPDGEQAMVEMLRSAPDVVVLDLRLPGISGSEVCHAIRGRSQVPILILTAQAGEEAIVKGLEMGADDYLTKPFSVREMRARVNALARRGAPGASARAPAVLVVGDLTVDVGRHLVTTRGRPVALTPTEFRLLWCLARNAGQVVTSRSLLREAQEYDCPDREAQEIVKVHIRHLRYKLELEPESPRYILTVRGFGYVLGSEASVPPAPEPPR